MAHFAHIGCSRIAQENGTLFSSNFILDEEGTPSLVVIIEGRKSLKLLNAMCESIETRKEVPLKPNPQQCKLGIS